MTTNTHVRADVLDDQFKTFPEFEDNGAIYFDSAVFWPEREKIAVFIDGQNLFSTMRGLQSLMIDNGRRNKDNPVAVDYKRMHKFFTQLGIPISVSYYTMIESEEKFSTIRPLIDWLDYNGYRLVTKLPRVFENETGIKQRGTIDAELIVDAVTSIYEGDVDHVILVSGNGYFLPLIELCQRKQIRVTVIATTIASQSCISDDLRRHTTQFIELYKLLPLIERRVNPERRESNVNFRPPHISRPEVESPVVDDLES